MCAELLPLTELLLRLPKQHRVANYQGETVTGERFIAEVTDLAAAIKTCKQHDFALYYEQAYEFAVSLFALLHSGKTVWIAANNHTDTAADLVAQGCCLLGNWQGKELDIQPIENSTLRLQALDADQAKLVIFTSASSGKAKAIGKNLQQLQNELITLETLWSKQLADSHIVATVSHQHIYGLLFRVLWPLAAGRCFYSQMFLSPEPLLKAVKATSACWVASPAQLKRLDDLSEWSELADLSAVFSSGGHLPDQAAAQIVEHGQHGLYEVYGSSETGGIGWRQPATDKYWMVFDSVQLRQDDQGNSWLKSAYLASEQQYELDDRIELSGHGKFQLLGRKDRIVKLEEKRLSLHQLENSLKQTPWVKESYTLLVPGKRDRIAAVLVLTRQGIDLQQQQGRYAVIKQLRRQLMQSFDTLVLPKKWLFVPALPLNTQAKIDVQLLQTLFKLDHLRFPQLQSYRLTAGNVALQFKIPSQLIYFDGHFPAQPILPGVTQLSWVEHFAKIFFNIEQPFEHMEVIKFKKIIRPGDDIKMLLKWKAETAKLYFELKSAEDVSHSSGRLVYARAA